MPDFRAMFVHGVGEQSPDFADDARRVLREGLERRGVPSWFRSVHWAPEADSAEHTYRAAVHRAGSTIGPAQRLAIGTLADALYYQGDEGLRERVWSRMDREFVTLSGPERRTDVVVFAHSLGCLITVDWLRNRPGVRVRALVTFGANLGLFSLGRPLDVPAQLRAGAMPQGWTNVYYPRDVLGFPLAVDPGLRHVRDVRLRPPTLLARTGLAHVEYWDDRRLWGELVPRWFT